MTGELYRDLAKPLGHAVIAPDLPGHGRSSHEDCSVDEVVESVLDIVHDAQPARLLGYSQGARMALLATLADPDAVEKLVVVSGNAGIRDADARRERQAADMALADRIDDTRLDDFLDEWTSRPMTSTAEWSDDDREADRRMRDQNTARGLADAIRGYGQGVQPDVWGDLPNLHTPTLVVTGSLDATYTAIGEELAATLPDAHHVVIEGAGHHVFGDEPDRTARAVRSFLDRDG